MAWATDHHPTRVEIDACVQCGLCLPVCPTFRLTGRETASPRGRIHAMAAVDERVVEVDEAFAEILDFCLGCRACEPICPGLVPYGRMLEGARAEIVAQVSGRSRKGRWLVGRALGMRRLLRIGSTVFGLLQRMRLTSLAPRRFRRLANGVRDLSRRGKASVGYRSPGIGGRGTVALLAGCIQDEWFRPVNRATVELLEKAGFAVEVPSDQTCCGALAAHDGHADQAADFSEVNRSVLGDYDVVVSTAAGCSAHLAGYEFGDGGPRVLDATVLIAEAISDGNLPTVEVNGAAIAIQDPCHLRHAQRVVEEPRQILRAAGYEVLETDPLGMCCGAAGMYTIHRPEASSQLGESKASQVRATGVSLVASANPGCEMQLRSHLEPEFDIRHPIEWYAESLQKLGSAG